MRNGITILSSCEKEGFSNVTVTATLNLYFIRIVEKCMVKRQTGDMLMNSEARGPSAYFNEAMLQGQL